MMAQCCFVQRLCGVIMTAGGGRGGKLDHISARRGGDHISACCRGGRRDTR